jgi:hypothetical protein
MAAALSVKLIARPRLQRTMRIHASYMADSASHVACLVKLFEDTRDRARAAISRGAHRETNAAAPRFARFACLLAGFTAAIGKIPNREATQAVLRHVDEHPDLYTVVDGLLWPNAHNDEHAWALYERAENAIDAVQTLALNDKLLSVAVAYSALENALELPTRSLPKYHCPQATCSMIAS